MTHEKSANVRRIILSALGFILILLLGIGLKYGLAALREPPPKADTEEPFLEVEVLQVHPEDVPVVITAYGEAKSLDVVTVTPQVAGNVVEIHPRLEEGEIIPAGELLFKIDPRDYEAVKAQAEARVQQLETNIALLKQQYGNDERRLETVQRTFELAQIEYERDKSLYEEDDVGSEAAVHMSEINLNQAKDAFIMLSQALDLYPGRIKEAESGLKAAKAQLAQASVSLERTEIRVDFPARVKMVQVERGQFVAPGAPALMLANDEMLQISVPLDSREARSWLRFRDEQYDSEDVSWFGELEPVDCTIRWTESPEANAWVGRLDHVQRFDPMTRMVTVAIRVGGETARGPEGSLPLVDGMFCTVDIPGKVMNTVYRIPRWAVSFEGQTYVAEEGRLKRRKVKVLRAQGEEAFVSAGLSEGDLVITTRLIDPLPNSLLKFDEASVSPAGEQSEAAPPPAEDATETPS